MNSNELMMVILQKEKIIFDCFDFILQSNNFLEIKKFMKKKQTMKMKKMMIWIIMKMDREEDLKEFEFILKKLE